MRKARQTRTRRFLLGASLPQALLEAAVLGGLGLWGLLAHYEVHGGRPLGQSILFFVPMVAFWYAIRLRVRRTGPLWRQVVDEVGTALALSPLVSGGWLWMLAGLGLYEILNTTLFGSFGSTLLILAAGPFFLAFRLGVRVWLFWERLRRRHLVWTFTHTQLQLVVLFAILVAIPTTLILVTQVEGPLYALDTWVFTILPFWSVGSAMALAGLLVVLPPALFLAWLTARRTTRRLEALAQATAALRQGDYTAHLPVEGEDEVAQLQGDFNAMAAALETAVTELQTERDKVAALLEARRQLVVSVSHELRTPLATLRGYLESIRQAAEQDTEGYRCEMTHDLAVMDHELNRLQRLIDDLFTLSRAEVGKLALTVTPVDVCTLVRQRVDAAAPLAWQRERVRIVADIPADLPPVLADEARLEQILINLLRNALRHTPPGGIVAISAAVATSRICLRVCDTGEGIEQEDLPHVWERFYRGDSATAHDTQGAGLGLALAKELAEAMDGEVEVESQPGAGSCFTVRLPIASGSPPFRPSSKNPQD